MPVWIELAERWLGRLAAWLAASPVPGLALIAAALVGFVALRLRDRLREERTLRRRREQRWRLFMDSLTDIAFYLLDTEGLVIDWDRGAERLMGYPPEEVI